MEFKLYPHYRAMLCGTRKTVKLNPGDFRVVCATCDAGGSRKHPTHDSASSAAIRDSNKPCRACGAD